MEKSTHAKRIISVFIAVVLTSCLIFSNSHQTVRAEDSIFSGDIDLSTYINDENVDGIKWDEGTGTLTLNSVTINGNIIVPNNRDITIELKSANTLNGRIYENMGSYHNLKIVGEDRNKDKLTICAQYTAIYIGDNFTLQNCELSLKCSQTKKLYFRGYESIGDTEFNLDNAKLFSEGGIIANNSNGKTNIKNSDITINHNGNSNSFSCNEELNIESSRINITADDNVTLSGAGIFIRNANASKIKVDINSVINISLQDTAFYLCLASGDINDISIPSKMIENGINLKQLSGSNYFAFAESDSTLVEGEMCNTVAGAANKMYIGTNMVTINGGRFISGDGYFANNATVTIDVDENSIPSGKKFKQWNVTNNKVRLANAKDRQTTFSMITEPVVISAEYENANYTINYHLDGGENNTENAQTYTIEDEITLRNPTKDDCIFEGWYTDSNFSEATKVNKIASGSMGNKDLYAKFTPNTHKLKINNGTSNTTDGTFIKGETVTITANTPAAGKIFANWVVKAGNIILDNIKKMETTFTGGTENVEISAKYENIVYSIQYHLDGGENNTENAQTYTIDDEITLKAPVKDDYIFEGWYTDENYSEGSKVDKITEGSTGNKDLYAKFIQKTYKLTLHNGTCDKINEIYKAGELVTITANTIAGKEFKGWKVNHGTVTLNDLTSNVTSFTGVKEDVEITAEYENEVYTINYYLDGGENDKDNPLTYTVDDEITLKVPVKNGYDFDGWYTSSELNNEDKITKISQNSTGDLKLYAKFVKHVETTAKEEITTQKETEAKTTTIEKTEKKVEKSVATGESIQTILVILGTIVISLAAYIVMGKVNRKNEN